jgi:hypothetical protein
MHRVVLATVVLATGCFADVPPRSSPATNVPATTWQPETHEVVGENFRFRLAADGVHLPESLTFDTADATHELFQTSASCGDPQLVGTRLFPFDNARAGAKPMDFDEAANVVQENVVGRAMVQLIVDYALPYRCGGTQQYSGSSTFTVYPSGRIVRNDVVRPTAQMFDGNGCSACAGAITPTFLPFLESYWLFNKDKGERIEVDNVGNDVTVVPGQPSDTVASCVKYGGPQPTHYLGLRWIGANRATTVDETGIAFTYDHFTAQTNTTISPAEQRATSVMVVGAAPATCAAVLARTQFPELVADDGRTEHPLELDDAQLFHSNVPFRDRLEIRTRTPGTAVLDGFAVGLDLGTADHLFVKRKDGTDIDHLVQKNGPQTILWVDGGLAAGDAVVIEVL